MSSGDAIVRDMDPILRRLRPGALVRIFVPSRDRRGRPLRSSALRDLVENGLADVAGGATTLPGRGIYRNGHQAPLRERVFVVESYLPSRLSLSQRLAIVRLLKELAIAAQQEAIGVVLDGRLYLLEGEPVPPADAPALPERVAEEGPWS